MHFYYVFSLPFWPVHFIEINKYYLYFFQIHLEIILCVVKNTINCGNLKKMNSFLQSSYFTFFSKLVELNVSGFHEDLI